jgi:hypothetical protein
MSIVLEQNTITFSDGNGASVDLKITDGKLNEFELELPGPRKGFKFSRSGLVDLIEVATQALAYADAHYLEEK